MLENYNKGKTALLSAAKVMVSPTEVDLTPELIFQQQPLPTGPPVPAGLAVELPAADPRNSSVRCVLPTPAPPWTVHAGATSVASEHVCLCTCVFTQLCTPAREGSDAPPLLALSLCSHCPSLPSLKPTWVAGI